VKLQGQLPNGNRAGLDNLKGFSTQITFSNKDTDLSMFLTGIIKFNDVNIIQILRNNKDIIRKYYGNDSGIIRVLDSSYTRLIPMIYPSYTRLIFK